MVNFTTPTSLVGERVRLDPLHADDAPALATTTADGELWKLWYAKVPRPSEMEEFVATRMAQQANGSWVPFVVREIGPGSAAAAPVKRAWRGLGGDIPGRVVGLTNFLHIDERNRRLEIGGTWYAASVQRTAVNTETKLLLLRHAFETLGCLRVELRTHSANTRSQAAIARLGAVREGVLRKHLVMPDGHVRDTVVFAIIDTEWPGVKDRLVARLSQDRTRP